MEQQQDSGSNLPANIIQVVQLVTFRVGDDLFGINVSMVHEVIKYSPLRMTPGAAQIIEGVIDLRGDIIPVIDLRKRIDPSYISNFDGTKIIITEIKDYVFGLVVDKVEEVRTFSLNDFMAPPLGARTKKQQFTLGMIRKAGQLLIYLDLEKVVDIDNLLIEEEA